MSQKINKLLQYTMLDGEQCLRDAVEVEGIKKPEGGQGGGRVVVKCSGKTFLKNIFEQRLEGGEVTVNHV